ncbi:hypothetical protein QE152_g12991 [Popillia japonica]|uniref:Transposase domain-containing protein n=1 Tax=Popillia japonica TaxID=7064 RepID=A0AAW1LE43_POPJA
MGKRKYNAFSTRHKRRLIVQKTLSDIERFSIVPDVVPSNPPESNVEEVILNQDRSSMKIFSSSSSNVGPISAENAQTSNHIEVHIENSENAEVNPSTAYQFVPTTNNTKTDSFKEKLTNWAINFNIRQNAFTALLKILNNDVATNYNLPQDCRALLGTPRKTKSVKLQGGDYIHMGLAQAIENICLEKQLLNKNFDKLELFINIDGLPLAKSSNLSLWPILCSEKHIQKVFLVGAFYGQSKPKCCNEYLKCFVDEAVPLINEGTFVNNVEVKIKIAALICDAPAKAFVLSTKGHTGYNSCSKCTIEGEYVNNRICFPTAATYTLRTDEYFRSNIYDDYQLDETILKEIPKFDFISNVPLDYMHLVCLGVVRKLLNLWLNGKPLSVRLSTTAVNQVSNILMSLQGTTPKEFCRKPRSLSDVHHWKATEFRNFLLYFGPLVLKKAVSKKVYLNFLSLHVAIRILSSSTMVQNHLNIEYAHNLLKYFTTTFELIYGVDKVSHNVHGLLHLCEDVKQFGALDQYSSFRFENYMKDIKKMMHKNEKPLEQLFNRYKERASFKHRNNGDTDLTGLHGCHNNEPVVVSAVNFRQYKTYACDKYYISCDLKNDCFLLKNGTIIVVVNIVENPEDNKISVVCKKLTCLRNLYETPCDSSDLDIFHAKLECGDLYGYSVEEIKTKM